MFKCIDHLRTLVRAVVVLMVATGAAHAASLVLSPATGSFDCGETYTLDVLVDASTTDLQGASLVLEFDGAILQALDVTAGDLITGAGCPHFVNWLNAGAPSDSVAVDLATLGCTVNGPGSIVRITFEGYVQGLSFIRVRSGILRDGQNNEIPFTSSEAEVDYRCPVADEAVAWGTVKAGYR